MRRQHRANSGHMRSACRLAGQGGEHGLLFAVMTVVQENIYFNRKTAPVSVSAQRRIAPSIRLTMQNDVLEGYQRGKQNGYRNDIAGDSDPRAAGRDSDLASQQEMGLWAQRRHWLDTDNRVDSILAGQDIALIFHRAEGSAYNNRSK